jgi:hypothetical protein
MKHLPGSTTAAKPTRVRFCTYVSQIFEGLGFRLPGNDLDHSHCMRATRLCFCKYLLRRPRSFRRWDLYVYMYACMYVCMYICMYVCCMHDVCMMYACTYVCMYAYTHITTHTHTHNHILFTVDDLTIHDPRFRSV